MASSSSIAPQALTLGLITVGGLACAAFGKSLSEDRSLRIPLNVFGINGSPYGEVLAMAMQGPIDVYWHHSVEAGHQHSDGHHHLQTVTSASEAGGSNRLRGFLDELSEAVEERTNPNPPSRAQKFNNRRQVENKLRAAYELDPAHYANYNAYYFFLTEPKLGTRPELTPGAAKLARRTIEYCLSRTDDPRPALTAAAATENLMELMFNDRSAGSSRFSNSIIREHLGLLDHCLARYQELARQWAATGNWDLLSPQRRLECDERLAFITKVRNAAETTLRRLEQQEQPPASITY